MARDEAVISFRVPREEYERIQQEAEAAGLSMSRYIRKAIATYRHEAIISDEEYMKYLKLHYDDMRTAYGNYSWDRSNRTEEQKVIARLFDVVSMLVQSVLAEQAQEAHDDTE